MLQTKMPKVWIWYKILTNSSYLLLGIFDRKANWLVTSYSTNLLEVSILLPTRERLCTTNFRLQTYSKGATFEGAFKFKSQSPLKTQGHYSRFLKLYNFCCFVTLFFFSTFFISYSILAQFSLCFWNDHNIVIDVAFSINLISSEYCWQFIHKIIDAVQTEESSLS